MNKEEKGNKEKLVDKVKKYIKNNVRFLNKKNQFNMMEVIVLMIITSIFGMFVGGVIMYGRGALNTGIKKELNEFVNTYTEILNDYYEEVSEEGLLEAGISGMINYLGDPYSTYMNSDANTAFNEKVNGEYVGIGTEIIQYTDGHIEFSKIYADGGAEEAGLKEGDILLKVEDKDISALSLDEVSKLVKGKSDTKVKLTIKRSEEEKVIEVKRKKVDIVSVTSEILKFNDKKIGYMTIDIFASNTKNQFEKQLKELEKQDMESLIIDVRGNSGGYLTTVTDMVSLFMKKDSLIYQLKTKDKIEKIYDKTSESRDYKIAILINGSSASASELLTATLMESHDAYVVGTTSYGKSKVQKTQELSNGSSIKYTFQEWLTPKGESIDGVGITPEYVVAYEASTEENTYDSQLAKALQLLTD